MICLKERKRKGYHVISQIVTNIQALNLAVFTELLEQILVKILEVILNLVRVERLRLRLLRLFGLRLIWGDVEIDVHVGSLVHVGEKDGWADGGFGVESGTTVSMPASSDLEVERTVHSVLLSPKYGCQMLRH